jgi:hypothetical protein
VATDNPGSPPTHHDVDIVYLQRLMHDGLDETIRSAIACGQVVINDVDDWYWGLDPRNQAFKHSHPGNNAGQNTAHYARVLSASSLLTVSTPYLGVRLKQYNDHIVLLENHIDVSRFTSVGHTEYPVVGWAGSTSHRSGDLGVLKGVLGRLTGEVSFQHSGHMDGSPLFSEEVGLPTDQVAIRLRTTAEEYPSLLDFHIGLVPLRDTPFNYAKSDIKGLEYAAAGIPFVASPSPAYTELRERWGDNVLIAKRPADYVRHIRSLIPLDRRIEVAASLIKSVQERDVHHAAPLYTDLFDSLVA